MHIKCSQFQSKLQNPISQDHPMLQRSTQIYLPHVVSALFCLLINYFHSGFFKFIGFALFDVFLQVKYASLYVLHFLLTI